MSKKSVAFENGQPSTNGTGDLGVYGLTSAEPLEEQPIRTEELVNINDLYVDLADEGLSDIATPIPARVDIIRPAKNAWVTVCADPQYTRVVVTYEHTSQERSTTFLVAGRELQEEMRAKYGATKRRLYLAQDFNKRLFLWPIGLPSRDGTVNTWVQSGEQAIERAKRGWVHVVANRLRQEYDIEVAKPGVIFAPRWPEDSFDEILRRGVRGTVLTEGDHPVLRRLREGA